MEPLRKRVNVHTIGGGRHTPTTSHTTPLTTVQNHRRRGPATTSHGTSAGCCNVPGGVASSYSCDSSSSSPKSASNTEPPVTNTRSGNVFAPRSDLNRDGHRERTSRVPTPVAVTVDELMTYPVDGQRRAVKFTAHIPRTRKENVTGEDGFTSRKDVTTIEDVEMTCCADNIRYTASLALRRPVDGLCTNPKKCGLAHFDARAYGTGLCGFQISTGTCKCRGKFIHIKEAPTAPETASVASSGGASHGPRAPRTVVARPAPRMMCWMNEASELGVGGIKCTHGDRCSYAHTEAQQVEKDYMPEFRKRFAAGTLITQAVVDEVVRVLMTNETYRADILDLVDGSWPALCRKALSSWFRLWFRAVTKLRTEEDPTALALFGEANGLEENMVWETVRRFQSCTSSFAMAEKRVFGASTSRIIGITSKKHDGQVTICQGGKSCNHGAHYPVCLGADNKPNPADNTVFGQVDLDNFNGVITHTSADNRVELLSQYQVTQAKYVLADADTKEKFIGPLALREREAKRRDLREQMETIRAKYLNSYPKMQVIPADTVLVVRAPVVKTVVADVKVDLADTSLFSKLPELTADEIRARDEKSARDRIMMEARAEERRIAKAAADADANAKAEAERLEREVAKEMLVTAIREYAENPSDPITLRCMFYEHAFETVDASTVTSRNYPTHTMEGKPIIYSVMGPDGTARNMMRVPKVLDLVSAFEHMRSAFAEATKEMTVDIAQEYISSGAIDHISFWMYIKSSLVREAWSQFKASSSESSWTDFYARVNSKKEEWDNAGITRQVVHAARNRRNGKSKHSKFDDDDGPVDEVIEYVDENCIIKKQYANFWAYFNKLPMTAIGAGFVVSAWASTLAVAEPALFSEYLKCKTTIKFDNWIQDNAVRAAVKVVYDAHDCSWNQAQVFSTIVQVRAPDVSFDEYIGNQYDVVDYCFSPASKNIGSVGGGVSWSVFKTNPSEYLDFYAHQSSVEETLETYKAKRAGGWSTVRYGSVVRTVLNSLTSVMPGEFKAVAKKMDSVAHFSTLKLDSLEKMISFIHENGHHPLGQKFVFIHKGTTYEVATSLWDGILYKLMVELSSQEPNVETISALRKLLPLTDADATTKRDEAVTSKLVAVQQIKVKQIASDIANLKGKRRDREAKEASLLKQRGELETSLDAKKSVVQQTATNIWASDAESGFTPMMELVVKVCDGEAITIVATNDAKPVVTKKVVKKATPANTFAVLMDATKEVKPTMNTFDHFDEFNPIKQAERALDAKYEAKKVVHTHYINVDRVQDEDREISYKAIIIGPFETKNAATPVFSLLRKQLQGGAVISKKSAKLFEVHIYLTRPDGKKANENCTRLEENVDNCMTELIAEISQTMKCKPSVFKTKFELPADVEDDDDTASTASSDSDDTDDSDSTCSSDSDDSSSVSSSDSEGEFILPGCEVNRSFAKQNLMPGGLELDSLTTPETTATGARNGKTFRHEGISAQRKDKGRPVKEGKKTRGNSDGRDARGDDNRHSNRDDDE